MSYKFHGTAPGKKAVERKMRKEEQARRTARVIADDSLGLTGAARRKRENVGSAYLKIG